MKKVVTAGATPAAWDPEALYLKAERYVQNMSELHSDDWEYVNRAGFAGGRLV